MRPAPLVLRLLRQRGFIIQEVMMKKLISLLLCAAMILGLASCGGAQNNSAPQNTGNAAVPAGGYQLSSLKLPASVKLPDPEDYKDYEAYNKAYSQWRNYLVEKWELAKGYLNEDGTSLLDQYLRASTAFIEGREGENAVYSPINIFFALSMLAECTGGETQAQILNVLGFKDTESLRKICAALWEENYFDAGPYTELLGASLWMNGSADLNMDTIAALAMYYYAEGYKGDPLDGGFNAAFKKWLDDKTGGLLKDQIDQLDDFDPNMLMTIATTIYFKGAWMSSFSPEANKEDVFHTPGGDITTTFMNKLSGMAFYSGDGFRSVSLPFSGAGEMCVILPDEGTTPEALIKSGAVMDLLLSGEYSSGSTQVRLSIPKFDVSSDLDLIPAAEDLGIKDAFNESVSDFSPLTKMNGVYVSRIKHDARVKIDEEGCEAAAFTVISIDTRAMMPEDIIEIKIDRPFVFASPGADGLPMFIGVVNVI